MEKYKCTKIQIALDIEMFLRVSFSMAGRSQGVSQSHVFLVYNQVRVPILRLEAGVSHGLVSRHVGLQLHGARARGGSPHDEARAAADQARRSVASVPAGAARAAGLGLHGRVDRLQQRLVLVGVLLGELY